MQTVEQEKAEVEIFKGANMRMQQSLFAKDEEIRRLTEMTRDVTDDDKQRKLIDNMCMEICRLKEQINILYKRL